MDERVTGQPAGDGTAPAEAVSAGAAEAADVTGTAHAAAVDAAGHGEEHDFPTGEVADHDEPHDTDAHDAHGAGHGHGPALGPIDWRAYGAGIVGAVLGLAVAAVLAVTTGYIVL